MGSGSFPSGSVVKNTPAMQEIMQEMWVWFLGEANPLEEGMANHSSVLAWRILWPEEPGGLQSKGLHRVRHNWLSTHTLNNWIVSKRKKKKKRPRKGGRKEGRKEIRKDGSYGICWHLWYNYYHYGWLQVANVILLNTKLGRDSICSISTIYP